MTTPSDETSDETSDDGRDLIRDDQSDELHVMPFADLVEHDPTEDCICGTRTEPVYRADGSNGWLVVHHALDGRP